MQLNHLTLTVRNITESRDWYISNLGLRLEFEAPDVKFAALEDDSGFGLLLREGMQSGNPADNFEIYFQVEDVDDLYRRLASRVSFDHPPQKNIWGYGPQLTDPNGYVLRFFDQRSVTK